jgi:hypothetical protein
MMITLAPLLGSFKRVDITLSHQSHAPLRMIVLEALLFVLISGEREGVS